MTETEKLGKDLPHVAVQARALKAALTAAKELLAQPRPTREDLIAAVEEQERAEKLFRVRWTAVPGASFNMAQHADIAELLEASRETNHRLRSRLTPFAGPSGG